MTTTKALHALIVFLIAVPLFVAWAAVTLVVGLSVLADKILPNADHGNCWTFSLAKWWREGGYLVVRPVPGVKMFGFGLVPHVFWVKDVQSCELQMTQPVSRYTGLFLIFRCWYFKYVIRRTENPVYGNWRNEGDKQ